MIAIIAAWVLWRFVIKSILEAHGIKIDDDPVIKTKQTKTLDELKEKYLNQSASSKAANEGLLLAREIKKMEEEIKIADRTREDLK